jgi:CheY-like chemotaxis protein
MRGTTTILLVEDDPKDAQLADFALQKILPGVMLSFVSDGIQAVRYLSGELPYADREKYPFPDVVLLDLQLPLMDGFDVLRWIRRQPDLKLLPVIAMTGSIRKEDSSLACKSGANLCVLKSQGFRLLAEKVVEVAGEIKPVNHSEHPMPGSGVIDKPLGGDEHNAHGRICNSAR